MEVAKVLHMNGGNGDSNEAISAIYNNLSLDQEIICIADLGCSSGPNTFLSVSQLIQTIDKQTKKNGHNKLPEFHVFLNDLPSNDFNNVFRSFSTFHDDLRKHNMGGEDHEFGPPSRCFVAGVAGSFYTRLFPSNSLHFVHSSYSLHWLSQVPDGIESNKGNIYLTSTSPPSVVKGYYEQYERDFVTFLKYRSERIDERWTHGIDHELIDEEKVNSFNIPLYNPSPAEVMYIVEKEGSFTINCLETSEVHKNFDNGEKYNMVQRYRCIAEPLLISHFGDELNMDQVFHKYSEIITSDCKAKEKTLFVNVTVSLAKK
ncbi:unnamed protein product [Withania somnifera]